MRSLWIAFLVIASLGSIYPFNFTTANVDMAAVAVFLESCCKRLGRGDILGNVLLFLPVGFTGMFALQRKMSRTRRIAVVLSSGVAVAFLLQLLQFFLPTRDENLQDVAWNTVGLVGGALFAWLLSRWVSTSNRGSPEMLLVPSALIAAWLSYRLIPFVPTLDLYSIKASLKPLLLDPQLSIGRVFHDTAAWLVVAYLLQFLQRGRDLRVWLAGLMLATFAAEILIVSNVVNASNVLGALIALLLLKPISRSGHLPAGAVAVGLLLALFVSGLSPFVVAASPRDFGWLPFQGFLGGSMYLDALSASNKVFLYGSLVYLLWKTNMRRGTGLALGIAVVLSIEWLQRYVIGHTPEITDPLLVVFAAVAIVALEKQDRGTARQAGSSLRSENGKIAAGDQPDETAWVQREVNMRDDQFRFLSQLAVELDCSVSGAMRKILRHFIDEFSGSDADAQEALAEAIAVGVSRAKIVTTETEVWQAQVVNLRPSQATYLERVAGAAEISVSRVVRRIMQRFADDLEATGSTNDGEGVR